MKIQIYTISEKLDRHYKDAIEEYQKRLSRYCKIQYHIFKTEADLTKKIPSNAYIINLSPDGEALSSESLAEKINNYGIKGNSNILIITNPLEITSMEQWCITKMDMSMALTNTILYEQIYRAYRIIHNQPYHK